MLLRKIVGGCVGGWVSRESLEFQEIILNAKKEIENFFFLPHQGAFNIFFSSKKGFYFPYISAKKDFIFLLWR
jgi:hypothetical protein